VVMWTPVRQPQISDLRHTTNNMVMVTIVLGRLGIWLNGNRLPGTGVLGKFLLLLGHGTADSALNSPQ